MLAMLFALLLATSTLQKDDDLVIEDDNAEGKAENQKVNMQDKINELPQIAGEQYIRNLTSENFEAETKNQGSETILVFFGADWCPHCRTFKKAYNIVAYDVHAEKKAEKLGKVKLCRHFE